MKENNPIKKTDVCSFLDFDRDYVFDSKTKKWMIKPSNDRIDVIGGMH